MSNATWIVVAGEGRARVFKSGGELSSLQQVDDFYNENHSATTLTEKQAIAFSESERKEKERDKFASTIAAYVEEGRLHESFARLKIIAEPKFLGMLLSYLSEQTKKLVFEKVSKDYSSLSDKEVEEILKRG
ncbi:host attachment protein [Paraburkholderia sp. EG285A]|uniref:host attachment protein n=1 Tax=Paraburkholderia sp. EG285A TaxID=3237009 RepID=UPI0034D2C10D